MRFREYSDGQPYGWLKQLEREGVASYSALLRLRAGKTTNDYALAKRVSLACGGKVSIAELCELPCPKRKRRRRVAEGADHA